MDMNAEFSGSDSWLLKPLTAREREVLQGAAEGLSSKAIAERLFLSTTTVKWYLKNIYRKLNVHNRTAAVLRGQALALC